MKPDAPIVVSRLRGSGAVALTASRTRSASPRSFSAAVVMVAAMCLGLPRPAAADGARLFFPHTSAGQPVAPQVSAFPGRGLYHSPLAVTLTTEKPGATIRFTADGSPPTQDYGIPYTGPVLVDRTLVLRARAFSPGSRPSAVTTHTYVFPEQVVRQPTIPDGFPRTWGEVDGESVPVDYEMDPEVAVYDARYRDRLPSDLAALPSMSLSMPFGDLFGPSGIYVNPLERGEGWERRTSVEWLPADGGSTLQVDAGVRIAGEFSRHPQANQKHSFAVRFRGEYGATKLRFPMFPGTTVDTFERLRLRAGQADTFEFFPGKAQYIHDEWGRQSQGAMGYPTAHGRFVHLYLNGLYWGLYNLTEELDAEFASQQFGGDESEYDVIKKESDREPRADDGDQSAFDQMLAIENLDTPIGYAAIQQWLDVVQYVDYTILELFAANRDWPGNNWTAIRRRVPGARFTFFTWDMEQLTQLWTYDAQEDRAHTAGAAGLHGELLANPEYRVLFGDRVHRHLSTSGALSGPAAAERYRRLASDVEPGIVAESARWGDSIPGFRAFSSNRSAWDRYWYVHGRGHPQTLDDEWIPERDRVLAGFFAERTDAMLEQFRRNGIYPTVEAPTLVKVGRTLRLSAPYGKLYFTLDGTDPRRAGGAVADGTQVYKGPRVIDGYAKVLARAEHLGQWSPVVEAQFGAPRVLITELMYHPPDGGVEFLELHNPSSAVVDLGAAAFVDGIEFTFGPGAHIAPSGYVVVAQDADAFTTQYPGVALAGVYSGNLSNSGEAVVLDTAEGELLAAVEYGDSGLWPIGPDGFGHSLALASYDPEAFPQAWHPEAWRSSVVPGGSPGRSEPPMPARSVVVSEVLARSSGAYEDAIELTNVTDELVVDIGGWYLSDNRSDMDSLSKFRISPGTVLGPLDTVVFYETDFGAGSDGFGLSADGEGAYLTETTEDGMFTGNITGLEFGASDPNQSFGRVDTSAGPQAAPLERPTFGVDDPSDSADFRRGAGGPNSAARVGPVVISELLPVPEASGQEFVELFNHSDMPVALYTSPDPASAWRLAGGVDYTLPHGTVLAAGERLIIVGEDPERFRRESGVPPEVLVLGPFEGGLGGDADEVVLERPVPGGTGAVLPAVEVDRAMYRALSPWPRRPAAGVSLERVLPVRFGAEPRAWAAFTVGGTPGTAPLPRYAVFAPFAESP